MSGYYYPGLGSNSGYRNFQQPNQQPPVPYGMHPGQLPMSSYGVTAPFNAYPSTYQSVSNATSRTNSNTNASSALSHPSSGTSPVYSSAPIALSLTDACKSGDLSKVHAAIQEGMRPDNTTLTWAFASKNVNIINAVSNTSAKADDETLNVAIATNDVAIVQMALKFGAKATSKTNNLLKSIQNQDIRRLLTNNSSHLDNGPPNELTRACQLKRLDLVRNAIQRNIPPQKETLLFAASSGDAEIVKEVINAGAVPHNDPSKENELNWACSNRNEEMVQDLIYAGVKPGESTLYNAFRSENENIIKNVVKIGAKPCENMLYGIMKYYENVDVDDEDNVSTAEKMISMAVDYGAKPDKDSLDIAFMLTEHFNWNSWLIDLLVKKGAKPSADLLNKTMNKYKTQGADKKDAEDEIEIAVKCGAKPDKDSLDIAIKLTQHFAWNSWLLDLLVKNGAKASTKSLTDVVCTEAVLILNYANLIDSVLKAGARPGADTFALIKWYVLQPDYLGYKPAYLLPESTVNELFKAGLKPTAPSLKRLEEDLSYFKDELKRIKGKRSPDQDDNVYKNNYDKLIPFYTDLIKRSRHAMSK